MLASTGYYSPGGVALVEAQEGWMNSLFNEYGVQIMTPAYEEDPAEPKVVPPGNWYASPAVRDAPGARPARAEGLT